MVGLESQEREDKSWVSAHQELMLQARDDGHECIRGCPVHLQKNLMVQLLALVGSTRRAGLASGAPFCAQGAQGRGKQPWHGKLQVFCTAPHHPFCQLVSRRVLHTTAKEVRGSGRGWKLEIVLKAARMTRAFGRTRHMNA